MPAPGIRDKGTRQDTFLVTVTVNGESFGVWDKKTGGAVDSDTIKYYPGGMVPPQSLGGRKTTDNVTLQRNYDRIDDHGRINTLFSAVGRGIVGVSIRPMDQDGNPAPRGTHYTGKLKRVAQPDVDSEATSAALLEIEVEVTGYPTSI